MFKLFKSLFAGTSPVGQDSESHLDQGRGNAFLAEGRFEEAVACYRNAMQTSPNQTQGYISLGYALLQMNRYAESDLVLQQALKITPHDVETLYLRASIASKQGHGEASIAQLRRLLELTPHFESAYGDLYQLLVDGAHAEQARGVIRAGIAHFPQNAQFHYLLGQLHTKASEYEQAETCYRQAVVLQPDYAELHFQLAAAQHVQNKLEAAASSYRMAISLKPDYAQAYGNLGAALLGLQQPGAALECLDSALQFDADALEVLINRSAALHQHMRFAEAVTCCDHALAIMPESSEAHTNRGNALKALDRNDEALASYNRADRLHPHQTSILNGRGTVFQRLNQPVDALRDFTEALELDPLHAGARLNASITRLQIGDFEAGWQEFEWRWNVTPFLALRPAYKQPVWLGKESLSGKTILLYAEQGLGDTIQFCRYAALVAEQGAKVLLLVPASLQALLSGLEGVERLLTSGQALPPFDYHCPLMSLPLAFGTRLSTVPQRVPYLCASTALIQDIEDRFDADVKFRIGICWKGSAAYQHDSSRSPGLGPFQKLMSQFRSRNVNFYTLVPGSRQEFSSIGGQDLGHEIDQTVAPFAETAALIMNLDLVITSDTSIAHVAGALGKPVWIVLPFSADWRWLLTQSDSPWYPSARLWRQAQAGNWIELFDRVAGRLDHVLNGASDLIWPVDQQSCAVASNGLS